MPVSFGARARPIVDIKENKGKTAAREEVQPNPVLAFYPAPSFSFARGRDDLSPFFLWGEAAAPPARGYKPLSNLR